VTRPRRVSRPRKGATPDHDSQRAALLTAARALYREMGYAETTFPHVAARAALSEDILLRHFRDREHLLSAVLTAHSPLADLLTALDRATGESAEELLRSAFHQLIAAISRREDFLDLALIDVQITNGAFLTTLTNGVFAKARGFLERMKTAGGLRPVSDMVIGRAIAALLMGYIVSERAMPALARTAMRMIPARAWLDGVLDLFLYGILEDDAR